MNVLSRPATAAMIRMTTRKYIQDMAEDNTLPFACSYTEEMYAITWLSEEVNASIIVYTVFTRIIGDTMGRVIFQKVSQPDAPSMEQDS